MSLGGRAISCDVVARCTAVRVTVRQTPVIKQSFPKQQTLWVRAKSGRDRRDRLLGWRVGDCAAAGQARLRQSTSRRHAILRQCVVLVTAGAIKTRILARDCLVGHRYRTILSLSPI